MVIGQLNRAFRYGDAVFETLRVQNSAVFNLPFHQKRLEFGLAALKINCAVSLAEITEKSGLENGFLRVQISRSGASKGYLPLSNDGEVTVEVINGFEEPKTSAKLFVSSVRQNLVVKAKTASSLHYVLASIQAAENSCDNALIIDAAGNICECASGNIFWFKGEQLFTPSLELDLIAGSVQDKILAAHKVIQGNFKLDEIKNADEVFMTNVNAIILPFAEILPLGVKYKIQKSLELKNELV